MDFNSYYKSCTLCPRRCGADRTASTGKTRGVCGESSTVRVGRAALHFWEEPCISGTHGSGAVFFAGCSLKCVYCQNYDLAHGRAGIDISEDRLADIFLDLQAQNAENINLVTGDHFLPQIMYAVKKARANGLRIPIVFNCSGYETVESLRLLEGIVDIYLTDFKYLDPELAGKYSSAPDYPDVAGKALSEMVRQIPEAVFDGPLMKRGIIVRHLLLPGHVRASEEVVRYLYGTYGDRIWLSLMNQYTPSDRLADTYPEIARKVTKREYNRFIDSALETGLTNAFLQEGPTAEESFIPAFDGTGI